MEFNMFLFPKPKYKEENLKLYEKNLFHIPKKIFVNKVKFFKNRFGKINDNKNKKFKSIENFVKKKNPNILSFNFNKEILNNKNKLEKNNLFHNIKNNHISKIVETEDNELKINIPNYTNKAKILTQKYGSFSTKNKIKKINIWKNWNNNNNNNNKNKPNHIIKKSDFKFNEEKIKLKFELNFLNILKEKNKEKIKYRNNENFDDCFDSFKEKFKNNIQEGDEYFPILLFTTFEFGLGNSNDIILYFHGNGEDMFGNITLAKKLCFNLNSNVIIMEYPGYSIYKGNPNEKNILKNSIHIYDFLKSINVNKIILIGRSIGTGPSTYLARYRTVHSLILISPFLSIKEVINNYLSKYLSWLIKQRFNNIKRIIKIKSPILLIHGKKDKLIPINHSELIKKEYENSKLNINKRKFIQLKKFKNMTHDINDIELVILNPIIKFFDKLKKLKIY